MGLYTKKGLYSGYDKKHKERDALDYYSTPTEEVENILTEMNIPLDDVKILEPCCGGGHMLKGIENYCAKKHFYPTIFATDVQKRTDDPKIESGLKYDFLDDNYPYTDVDYVIMNPPYATIEPFTMKALEIANTGVLLLGRLQFLEGEKRFKHIFKENPPSDVYVYVDRIACYKNGDVKQKMASAQAYAWFYWDKKRNSKDTFVHFLRRENKK
ncbi:MAG: hypothetical protein MSA65_03475 [Mollicutes bacterium]|nr:hypothetical protein [Mollicutes bacterium]